MKFTLTAAVFSAFLIGHVSAQAKVNELGYPFSAPDDFANDQGDLSWEQIYADDAAKQIMMERFKDKLQTSKTSAEIIAFIDDPMIKDYLIRETKTWEYLPDPVLKSYVTTESILDNETGSDFKAAVAAPDPTKALSFISFVRDFLTDEAKVKYLLHPVMENSYLSEDQKNEVLAFVKDKFSIPQKSVDQYINEMRQANPD